MTLLTCGLFAPCFTLGQWIADESALCTVLSRGVSHPIGSFILSPQDSSWKIPTRKCQQVHHHGLRVPPETLLTPYLSFTVAQVFQITVIKLIMSNLLIWGLNSSFVYKMPFTKIDIKKDLLYLLLYLCCLFMNVYEMYIFFFPLKITPGPTQVCMLCVHKHCSGNCQTMWVRAGIPEHWVTVFRSLLIGWSRQGYFKQV